MPPITAQSFQIAPGKGIVNPFPGTPRIFKAGDILPDDVVNALGAKAIEKFLAERRIEYSQPIFDPNRPADNDPIGGTIPHMQEKTRDTDTIATLGSAGNAPAMPAQVEPEPEPEPEPESEPEPEPEPEIVVTKTSKWTFDPTDLADCSADELRLKVLENDDYFDFETLERITKEQLVAILSKDFKD